MEGSINRRVKKRVRRNERLSDVWFKIYRGTVEQNC